MLVLSILEIVGFGIGGFLISFLCNGLLLRFSRTLGIRNKNDVTIRWSNESKPSLGGISFFIVFIFSAIGFSIVFFENNIFHNKEYIGLFVGGCIAFLMGLADDAYNTQPLGKLFIQISCGLILIATGTIIDLSHIYLIDTILTVVWVVIVMNSLNMLDNMDGITATTVFFILISCLVGGWLIFGFNVNIWTLSLISIIGSIMGFLYFNLHPAKIFMGDAGSQFIGFFVAFFSVKFLWNVSSKYDTESWASLLIVLIAFTPAAADTLTVVINRLKKGKSPMVGGKDHTTHHLVYAGYNDKQVWILFFLIGLFSFLLTIVMINLIQMGIIIPILVFALYFIVVFGYLYRNTIKFPQKK
jgi:UDP-GlcNAc:undecaprenyl-phosphate GlcNAc-1-phosphate transferase